MNLRLRQDLGIRPVYSWQWSEDVRILVRDEHEDGTPKYKYAIDPESLVIQAVPSYTDHPMCAPFIEDQWVLCSLMQHGEEVWRRLYGEKQAWPPNGQWMPLNGPSGYVCLPKGKAPDQEENLEVIRLIRESRTITGKMFAERLAAGSDRRERAAASRRRDYIRDKIPFMAGIPGTKGDYSFGGFEKPKSKKRKKAA